MRAGAASKRNLIGSPARDERRQIEFAIGRVTVSGQESKHRARFTHEAKLPGNGVLKREKSKGAQRVRKNSRRRGLIRNQKKTQDPFVLLRCACKTALRFVREDSMRQLFRWAVGLTIVTAAASASAQTDQVVRGMKVFGEQKCSMCHSIAGKGNAKGVLDNVGAQRSGAEIREWLVDPDSMRKKANAERKPAMKSFAKLSKEDLDGLVAYLQTLKSK